MSETNDTSGAGTQPQAIGQPIAQVIEPPRFHFPRGQEMLSAPDVGPFGEVDQPDWRRVPRLGYSGFPTIGQLTLTSQTASPFKWIPYTTRRPVVLTPIHTTIPSGATGQLTLRYSPGNSGTNVVGADVNSAHGFHSNRCAAYLWGAGKWFLNLGGAGDTEKVTFAVIPCEDRNTAEMILGRGGFGANAGDGLQQVASVATVAAVAINILELKDVLFYKFVRIVNAGAAANNCQLKWAGTPTANDGFRITQAQFIDFEGPTLAVARLRALTSANSTIEAWAVTRDWSP